MGFNAGKLVQERKRLLMNNIRGSVLVSGALPADAVNGPAAITFWDEVATLHE